MGLDLNYIEGQTPLDEEEMDGLLIPTISVREELDQFEQQNIEEAIFWTLTRKFKTTEILSEKFVREVHKKMFCNIWKWSGEFRKTNKNIGTEYWKISTELKKLMDDTLFWINHTTFSSDEIVLRFKHRLVSIHCFPNGNGRHSRLMADILIENAFGLPHYSWGANNLSKEGEVREKYLQAVKLADKQDYSLLLAFARS